MSLIDKPDGTMSSPESKSSLLLDTTVALLYIQGRDIHGTYSQDRRDPALPKGERSHRLQMAKYLRTLRPLDTTLLGVLTSMKPLQAKENFERAVGFIRSAAAQGAELAVLPEYHLTNWFPNDPKFAPICADWEYYLKAYQALAKELNICIVPGTIVRTPPEAKVPQTSPPKPIVSKETRPFSPPWSPPAGQPAATGYLNTSYFISNDGSILGSYTKKNLWGPAERSHLASSGRTPHEVFDTPIGKVGLLICWDLAFPEAFRELIAQGAKTIIIPTFWTLSDASDAGLRHNPSAEALYLNSMTTARAFENTCAVVLANVGGRVAKPGKQSVYMGLSQVCLPFVGAVSRLGTMTEGMFVVDVDMDILEDAEANYQVRADMAHDDWHYDYRHSKSTSKL